MRHDRSVRVFLANLSDAAGRELHVDITIALPKIHWTPGPLDHPRTQVLIGNKKNISIRRSAPDDFLGVAAGADHVGERLHPGAAIDVGDDVIILVGVLIEIRL